MWYEGFHQGAYEFLFGERERQICMVNLEEAMHQISEVSEGFLTNTFFFFRILDGKPNALFGSKKHPAKTHAAPAVFEVLWSATSQAMVEMGEIWGGFFRKILEVFQVFFF